MSQLKNLIHEIHRRSLWQVLAIYVAAAWLVLQVVEVLVGAYGLPLWFPGLAAALLLMGLPVVLATAFVQEGLPATGRFEPTLLPELSDPDIGARPVRAVAPRDAGDLKRLLTWRKALSVGLALFAIWGIVAGIWLLIGFRGLVVKAEAADFFSPEAGLVVAEFENDTDEPTLGLAITEAVITDLDQSEYVSVVDRNELAQVLDRMRLPDTARIDLEVAVEIARREGYPAVVAGGVSQLGSGYQLTARIIEASSGEVAVRLRETAADASEVIPTVERLARLTRRHLGESLTSLKRSQPLPEVTTASLDALELFAEGRALMRRGEPANAVPILEEAVGIDTAFAAAYRALSVAYGNMGNTAAGQTNAVKAFHHAERLIDVERYMAGAIYHMYRMQPDSAAYYYQRAIEIEPNDFVAVNNLGDLYERMGRYEEALSLYQRSVELDPDVASVYVNIFSAAATLGQTAKAESAVAELHKRFPESFSTLYADFSAGQYSGDFDRASAAARRTADLSPPIYSTWGQWALADLAALHGRVDEALAHADSAMRLAAEAGSLLPLYLSLQTVVHTALAAGAPERVRPYLETARLQATDDPSPTFKYLALSYVAEGYALMGELDSAQATLARMDSLAATGDFRPYGVGEEPRAMLALVENRPQESLEHLRQARADNFGLLLRGGKLLLGDTYAALGRLNEAAALYDSLTTSYLLDFRDAGSYGPLKPLAHERAADVYLALGDTTAAIRHLTEFTRLWENADLSLRPRVESAQQRLARLAGEAR